MFIISNNKSIIIPSEIINIILNYINDTKTYFKCRLVCKEWNKVLENGKIFNNNGSIKNIIYFEPENIKYFDNNDKLKAQVFFYKYGYYKYVQYDYQDKENFVIENAPFKLIKKKYINLFLYENTTYNIYNNKRTHHQTNFHPCMLM